MNGNDLYIAINDAPGDILKIDITASVPTTASTMQTRLTGPVGLALNGDDLYISESPNWEVVKIDITDTTNPKTRTTVVSGFKPKDILLNGNDLYIADYTNNRIVKIDINGTLPATATVVAAGIDGPFGLALRGDDLYVSNEDGAIYKIDLTITSLPATAEVLVDGLSPTPNNGNYAAEYITMRGDELYFSRRTKISKIPDVTAANPTVVDVVDGFSNVRGIAFSGTTLYVADAGASKIYKIENAQTLSINDFSSSKDIGVYPNPSSEFIELSGLAENKKYTVYNVLGYEIINGTVTNNEQIDIRSFNNGLYLLRLEDGNTIKFLKE